MWHLPPQECGICCSWSNLKFFALLFHACPWSTTIKCKRLATHVHVLELLLISP
uniref:Uncharacterized protein n=1 Tax=Arundo donax TaxID=35708 RepID=A0A0A9A264_ARUDO